MHHVANRRSNSASDSQSPSSQQHQKFSPSHDSSASAAVQQTKKRKPEVLASPEPALDSSSTNLTVLVNNQQQSVDEQLSGPQPPTSHSSPLSSSLTSNNNNKQPVGSSEPGSSTSSQGGSRTRSRRVFNFTTSALGVQRFKRLALDNKKLLRKYGVISIEIRDSFNGKSSQRFDLPKRCPPSPPLSRPLKYKPIPKATQFAPITQNLIRGGSATTSTAQLPPARPNKLAAVGAQQSKSASSLSMEQRTASAAAVPHQLSRIPSQQLAGQSMQQEPGTSVTETPLLMNLLSSNNNNSQQMNPNNGMPPQQQPPSYQQQQANPMMRYPSQQQLQSPMYPGAQQSPQYMQGRIPPGNLQQTHPMMMQQSMAPNAAMPGQIPQQQMPPQATMPPPVAQAPEPAAKKRKRQTKKQKEEESKKQQQQQQTPTQMHPNIMPQGGMQAQGAMHPDFYMMQQGGQQRVPPIHMASSQMQQYRSMSYPAYGQHPQHYGQPTTPMMANPQQYPGQQAYPQQQMWNPNMPQHHMAQQQSDYHMQMQRNQMQQQGGPNAPANLHHYPNTQQSPDIKSRPPPPSYNDSLQQQFAQQQQRQTPSFMSPPPGPHSNQGPPSNYSMQQPPQQMMHQSQAAAQHYAQLQHQRVMSDIGDPSQEAAQHADFHDIMATIGGDGAEDFDLDSIELEPMRGDGNELSGMQQQAQSVPTPQQAQQHPGPSPHYYQQQPPSMPSNYGQMYGSPSSQQFAQQQNYQMHPNMMPPQQIQQREQQITVQKTINREQQQKMEQKQLEAAMNRLPDEPHSPSTVDVPIQQQQRVATAIECVMEKVMSGKCLDDTGASTSSQPTPPPNKRSKKASTAKNAQQQQAANAANRNQQPPQIPVQAMPIQQSTGQFVGQMPPNMYGNGQHPGTPTQFNSAQQQQQFYYHQQRMQQQQMHIRQQQLNYPGQQGPGPSTPLSAPPVSTPDQQYFYNQQQGSIPPQSAPNGAPPTPSRANSFKNIMPRNEASNPHTPQTPSQQQPTPQQMSQKMFSQENGGSSATSSVAGTPSSSSQHRMSIDEQSQPAAPHVFPPNREEQFGQQQTAFSQQQQYAQYNGHANPHFTFNQQQEDSVESEIKMQSTAVSLKSQQAGELSAPSTKLSTPPSANSGISSATPTTASQLNHHVETEPIQQQAIKQESGDLAPAPIKHELNNSHDRVKEELLSPANSTDNDGGFGAELAKSELNGPTSTAPPTATTSTVAE